MIGSRTRRILALALPIIGGMVSQNVLNLVDLAMVGQLGDTAVAAVGLGGFANFMATAFITGLSSGVQAMSARRLGEEKHAETAVPLNGALVLALAMGLPLSAFLLGVVDHIFPLLHPDAAVAEAGTPYLQARLVALVAVGMNFSFRGYWNGINRSTLYLVTLLVMHACNIVLNWVFIFGKLGAPELGAAGAGVASMVATFVGTGIYFAMGIRYATKGGFLRGLPSRDTFRTILRLALPTSVQQFAFAAGFTSLFWIIGHIGLFSDGPRPDTTAAVAAANGVLNVTLVGILPGLALGMAAASLVGQALGRRDPTDAMRWGWDVVRVGVVVMGLLGLPMFVMPELILSPFLQDAATRELAATPLRVVGAVIAIDAVGMILMNALLGAGASRVTMVVSITVQWCLFLPIAFVLGPVLGFGLLPIWVAYIAYRAILAGVFAVLWKRGRWAQIKV